MTATEIHDLLMEMAAAADERGDLGPWRVWDEYRDRFDEDAHHVVATIVKQTQGAKDSSDLVGRLRRAAKAFG